MAKITIIRLLLSVYIPFQLLIMFWTYTIFDDFNNLPEYEMTTRIIAVQFISSIILLPALISLWLSFHYFLKHGYFNTKSRRFLKISGYILAVNTIITLILDLALCYIPGYSKWEQFPGELSSLVPVLLIGIGLLVVVDFMKQGESIEQENAELI